MEDAILTLRPETPSNNDDLVEVRDGVFLSVSPPSPFQVTFDPKQPTSSNSGELSYMSTPSDSKLTGSSEPSNPDDGTGPLPTSSDFSQGPSDMRFRLTPLSIPPTLAVDPPKSSTEYNRYHPGKRALFLQGSILGAVLPKIRWISYGAFASGKDTFFREEHQRECL
jgi:hypothetical protein